MPPMTAGAARIRVTFQVDADGLLSVTAREQTTGIEGSVQVKPSYGLSDGEIETMLRESMLHAGTDIRARQLSEQRVAVERIGQALEAALTVDGERLLDEAERRSLQAQLQSLRELAQSSDDPAAIKQAIAGLNEASTEFAARRMNAGINSAMAGHKLDEFS
jgi:molecular chaperone HscA